MRHPWTVVVLLALTALASYAVGARPVQAQAEAGLFQVGDIVTFSFQSGGTRPCRIEEMKGTLALCGNPDRQGPPIGKHLEEWVNIAVVEWVMRVRD